MARTASATIIAWRRWPARVRRPASGSRERPVSRTEIHIPLLLQLDDAHDARIDVVHELDDVLLVHLHRLQGVGADRVLDALAGELLETLQPLDHGADRTFTLGRGSSFTRLRLRRCSATTSKAGGPAASGPGFAQLAAL